MTKDNDRSQSKKYKNIIKIFGPAIISRNYTMGII